MEREKELLDWKLTVTGTRVAALDGALSWTGALSAVAGVNWKTPPLLLPPSPAVVP
jgi:hypothetical protein